MTKEHILFYIMVLLLLRKISTSKTDIFSLLAQDLWFGILISYVVFCRKIVYVLARSGEVCCEYHQRTRHAVSLDYFHQQIDGRQYQYA